MFEPRRPQLRRRALIALAICAALYLVALGVASSQPVERILRERLHGTLGARLGDVRLGEELRVDPLFRVWFGPLEVPSRHGGAPVLRVSRVMARASLPALLRGRLEPATILLGDVRLRPGPGGRELRALVERVRGRRAFGAGPAEPAGTDGGRDLPKLKLRGLVVTLPGRGGEPLEAGPIDAELRLSRAAAGPRLDGDVRLRAGGRITLAAERAGDGWRGTLHGEDLGPDLIPPELRGRAATITAGAARLDVDLEAPADLSRLGAQVRAEVEGLVLGGERIGPEPVGPLRASASAQVSWSRAERRVVVSAASATFLRAVTVTGAAELHLGPPATFQAAVRAERVEWLALLAALPPALAVPPQAPRPAGPLSARLDVSGPLLDPGEWSVSAALDLAALREASRRAGRSPLAESFVHRPPLDGGGRGPELRVGPESPAFVPVAELPEYVLRAVTTSEDAGFFAHAGFDFDELRIAIAQGARRGRVVRGGSTITQQVAKNLFLDGERTFARKVREALVAVGLEATLPKRRILEIYLNVAEWGPGLWGIGPAARHWFGKDARALTPREAALLASVIPSPVRYHEALFGRGALSEPWEARLDDLLFTMNLQGALDDATLAAAVAERVSLAPPATAAAGTEPSAPGAPSGPSPVPAREER